MKKLLLRFGILPVLGALCFATLTSESEPGAYYKGFAIASVWQTTSSTITVSIAGSVNTTTGQGTIGLTAGGSVTATVYSCCVPSNTNNACNFTGENGACANGVVRPPHPESSRVYPTP